MWLLHQLCSQILFKLVLHRKAQAYYACVHTNALVNMYACMCTRTYIAIYIRVYSYVYTI